MPDDPSTSPGSADRPAADGASAPQREESSPEPIDMLAPLFREQPLPPEGMEAPPMWLWMVIFGVILFSTFYLGSYIGDFSPDPWLQSSKPVATTGAAPEEVEVDGAQIYTSRCANCHQANGEGVSGAFPPLNQAQWVTDNKGQIIRILLHGMIGEVEVRGNVYNGNMPAWGQLSDAEIAAVITHVRQSWENDASEVTADEVKTVRDATGGRVQPWTAEELMQPENMEVGATASDTTTALRLMRGTDSGRDLTYAPQAEPHLAAASGL
jgi:mono/diheme cytochrome c family protein